jgi:hypothetical protein
MLLFPNQECAFERIIVGTQGNLIRKFFQPLGIPAAEHDVVTLQYLLQLGDGVIYGLQRQGFPHAARPDSFLRISGVMFSTALSGMKDARSILSPAAPG